MGVTAGQKVYLSGANLYASSTASRRSGTVTGYYYIWSASTANGRIRITNRSSYVGRTPAGTYVTGWVNTSALPSTASSTASKTTTTPTATKTTTTTTTAKVETVPATSPTSSENSTVSKAASTASDVTPTGVTAGQIGYLGKVLFIVSSSQIKQLTDLTMEQAASIVTHDRHLRGQRVEFTGANAKTMKFSLMLSRYLGTDVWTDYQKLEDYCKTGTAVPMRLGSKTYGGYRWLIEKLTFTGEYTDQSGNWTQAKVDVTLREYEN